MPRKQATTPFSTRGRPYTFPFRLSEEEISYLQGWSKRSGTAIADLIREAINSYIAQDKKKKSKGT